MRKVIPALLWLLAGCHSLGTPIAAPHTGDPWLTLTYGPGMIGIPWRALITGDGRVSMTVDPLGESPKTYRQQLSASQLRAIRDALAAARLEELERFYSEESSDLETLRIEVRGQREVVVYGRPDRPELHRFFRVWNAAASALRVPRV